MSGRTGATAALCRLACLAGAVESGCSEDVQAQLEQLGINFGYMFQIRDDLLDFVSDTEEEGKLTQMDFREGILTLPVLYAMQDPQAKDRIIDLLREAKEGTFTGEHASAERALQAVETLPDHGVSAVFRELLQTKCKVSAAG